MHNGTYNPTDRVWRNIKIRRRRPGKWSSYKPKGWTWECPNHPTDYKKYTGTNRFNDLAYVLEKVALHIRKYHCG